MDLLLRLYEDSKRGGTCTACGAALDWYETLKGNNMPMNAGAVPRKSETHPETGRVVVFFAADDTHWTTCPQRDLFRSPKAAS